MDVRPPRSWRGLLPLCVGAAALAATAASAADTLSSQSVAVNVVTAASKCFSSVVNATGYIVPRASAVVMFNAPGFRLSDVSVKEGDTIKKGDTIAIATALPGNPVAAKAPNGAPVRLPIASLASGVVLKRNVEDGDLSSTVGGPLVTLAVDGQMEAVVDVPSIHVLELTAGQSARILMDDGTELSGHVRSVPVEIDSKTQVGQARISIDSDQRPMMGRFVRTAIDADRSCGIAVPLGALTRESDGVHVQVVKNGVIETRLVKVGLLSETDAEIMDGLSDGDAVVADAGTSLRDGDRVRTSTDSNQDQR